MEKKCDYCGTKFNFTVKKIKTIMVTEEEGDIESYFPYIEKIELVKNKKRVVQCPACKEQNTLHKERKQLLSSRIEK